MPDPHVLIGMQDGGRAHRRRGRARARASRSSATTTSTARPLRRCSRASCAHGGLEPMHPHSRPHLRGLRPERRGDPRARRTRRDAARHGRLRHHQPSSRSRKRGGSASMSSSSTITRPTRRCRRRSRGQSEPARRSLQARPSRRGRARVHDDRCGEPRAAHAAASGRAARPEPDLLGLARSRRARHRRRRGAARRASTAPSSPRGCIAMRRRDNVGPHRADGRRAARPVRPSPGTSASCSGRASMPAGASAAPTSARGCCSPTIRPRPRRSPPSSTGSTRAPGASSSTMVAQAEAEAIAALGLEEKGAVVVTASAGWHPGVVGLVAARLKEQFGRPAFAIALEPGGIGTGSGRSIAGVDLGRAVRRAVAEGLLLKGGGHAMAAGVTIAQDALAAFRAYLEETLGAAVAAARRDDALLIDGAVTAGGANAALIATIERAQGRSAPAIRSRYWRCPRTRSRMPRRSGRRMCACGCAPATARCSTRSRSAPPASRSARRCSRTAANRCTSPARSPSIAGRAPSACNCGCRCRAGRHDGPRLAQQPTPRQPSRSCSARRAPSSCARRISPRAPTAGGPSRALVHARPAGDHVVLRAASIGWPDLRCVSAEMRLPIGLPTSIV